MTTKDVMKKFDLCRQYDVFEPWLKECDATIDDLPMAAKTETGEDVIVEAEHDDDGKVVWKITTLQKNNWLRINYYHEDGTVEELYEH